MIFCVTIQFSKNRQKNAKFIYKTSNGIYFRKKKRFWLCLEIHRRPPLFLPFPRSMKKHQKCVWFAAFHCKLWWDINVNSFSDGLQFNWDSAWYDLLLNDGWYAVGLRRAMMTLMRVRFEMIELNNWSLTLRMKSLRLTHHYVNRITHELADVQHYLSRLFTVWFIAILIQRYRHS